MAKVLLGNIRGLTGDAIQTFGGPAYTYPSYFGTDGGVGL